MKTTAHTRPELAAAHVVAQTREDRELMNKNFLESLHA
jgi:hypothetical protein